MFGLVLVLKVFFNKLLSDSSGHCAESGYGVHPAADGYSINKVDVPKVTKDSVGALRKETHPVSRLSREPPLLLEGNNWNYLLVNHPLCSPPCGRRGM